MAEKLTNTFVRKQKPHDNRYWIADTKCPGLTLAVYPSGSKVYYYRYKHKRSRQNNSVKIGNAEVMTVDQARESVSAVQGDIAKGFDPKVREEKKLAKELQAKVKQELRLFNYIDQYYKPYTEENSASSSEIISTLKREFEFIKSKPIDRISSMDIDQWREKRRKNITFARMQRIFTYLKACINTAVKHYKLIDHFELQTYTLKRKRAEKVNDPKIRYLTKDEEARLLSVLDARDSELRDKRARYIEWHKQRNSKKKKQQPFKPDDYPDHITPIIILAYQTGFDIGDIFDLDWQQHIDFANNQIRKIRNKTMHNQDNPQPVVVPMSPKVKAVLKQWGQQHSMKGRVFVSPVTGGRIDNINKAWRAIRAEAGLVDFRLKDFRHTFASWLAIGGTPLIVIRDLMGHTNIKTTEVYAHLCPTQKDSAVANIFG